MEIGDFQTFVKARLAETGLSDRQASLRAIGRPDLISDIKSGSMPAFDRACKLLKVLGIDIDENLNKNKFNSENTVHLDGRLAEMMSLLAAEWGACDARGQSHLVTRFHAYFPELGDKPTNRRSHD